MNIIEVIEDAIENLNIN